MYAIVVLICLIYGVLSLILFFKVWGMTNDVRELKEALLFEVQKKNKESNLSYNSIQSAKKELAEVKPGESGSCSSMSIAALSSVSNSVYQVVVLLKEPWIVGFIEMA